MVNPLISQHTGPVGLPAAAAGNHHRERWLHPALPDAGDTVPHRRGPARQNQGQADAQVFGPDRRVSAGHPGNHPGGVHPDDG